MRAGSPWRWVRASSPWFGLALLAGSFLAYATTLRSPFISDDFEMVHAASEGPSWTWITELGPSNHVRPVPVATVWLSRTLGGTDPLGYHVFSVAMHAVVAWLVALLAAELLRGHAPGSAIRRVVPPLAGAVFLLSPTHAEAVSWIVCRTDLLLSALLLGATITWFRFRRGGGAWAVATVALFALALLTKEVALLFPLVLVAQDLWLPGADGRLSTLRRSVPALGASVVLVAGYLLHYRRLDPTLFSEAVVDEPGLLLGIRRTAQLTARTVLPGMPIAAWVVAGMVAVVAVSFVAVRLRDGQVRAALRADGPQFGFLLTALVLGVAPVGQFGAGAFTPAGGRLAYFPSAFATIAVVLAGASVLAGRPALAKVVAGAVLVACAAGLVLANDAYVRAGRLSGNVVASMATWPVDERAVALVAIDDLDGIPVGRNAWTPALALEAGWEDRGAYVELFALHAASGEETVTVTERSCDGCYRLQLQGDGASLGAAVGAEADETGRITFGDGHATLVDDRTIDLVLTEDADPSALWIFSDGQMVPFLPR